MQRFLMVLTVGVGLIGWACSQQSTPISAPAIQASDTVTRYAPLCQFPLHGDEAEPLAAAKINGTQAWAKDRYASGLSIEWNVESHRLRQMPVFQQALDLVADTVYAMILPTKGIDRLPVFIQVKDLSGISGVTAAQGGGDFYTSGANRGMPVAEPGRMGIRIDDYELDDTYDKPLYISSLGHWYTILLHETFHVFRVWKLTDVAFADHEKTI